MAFTALEIPEPDTRRRILLGVPVAMFVALLEAVGFGLILPFIQVVADPESATTGRFAPIYDRLGQDEDTFVLVLGLVIFGSLLLKSMVAAWLLYWQAGVLTTGEAQTGSRLFRGYLHAPYVFHLERNSAELSRNLMFSVQTVYRQVLFSMVVVLTEAFVIAAVVVVLLSVDVAITFAAAGFMGLVAIGYGRGLSRFATRVGERHEGLVSEAQRHINEGLGGVKTIQVFGQQATTSDTFDRVARRWAETRRFIYIMAQAPRYYLETALTVGSLGLTLVVVTSRSSEDALSVLGLLVAAAFRTLPSLNRMLVALHQARVGAAASSEIARELATIRSRPEEDDVVSVAPLRIRERVTVDDVTWTYPGRTTPALDHVTLDVRRGESVGVVGSSGSGKTTLVDVLLGLLEPQSGAVRVDGRALDHHTMPSWRASVGYVPQDVFLLDDTLEQNIAFGREMAEDVDQRVAEVVRLAHLGSFVQGLPEGLATRLGERGVRLSGGQRQRIGIARALYARPELLVLDEATSALDSATEAGVAATIDALRSADLTLVIVAHRLSTVKRCDRIVLVDAGAVRTQGTFEALAREDDEFAHLVQLAGLGDSDGTSSR